MPKEFTFLENKRLKTLINLFNTLFRDDYNTLLVGGGCEPVYQPADSGNRFNRIVFTRDYFSSALHEVAHWCIAGEARRKLVDYGYWYAPDGRNHEQQKAFESVEVKPQAIERIFSKAADAAFNVSADNLEGCVTAEEGFARAVHQQTIEYCSKGLPNRANLFARGLASTFEVKDVLAVEHYSIGELLGR